MRIAPYMIYLISAILALGMVAAPSPGQSDCKALCIDDFEVNSRVFWNESASGLGHFTFSGLRGGELLVDNGAGTLRIVGEIVSVTDSNKRFAVDITFTGRVAHPDPLPPGSPKLPDDTSLLVGNGGPVDPLTWDYYPNGSGSFIGGGDYAGAVVQVDLRGPAAQVGFGGDLMDASFGISVWLDFTTLTQPSSGSLPATWVGDINGNIERECADIPYPGSGDDFRVCTGINGPPSCGPGQNVKSALVGDIINFKIESPAGTHAGKQVLFYVNCWNTCLPTPPFFMVPGFEFIYLTPGGGNVELFGPTSPFGFPTLDSQGCLAFDLPILFSAFEGMTLLFQAYVVDGNALNGAFAATDAHRIDIGFLPGPAPAPLGVAAGNVDDHGATLTWNAVNAAPELVESYEVFVDGVKVGQTTGTSFDVGDVPELTSVALTVSARTNTHFETMQSAPVQITTLADNTPPAIVGAVAVDDTTVEVRFDEIIETTCANDATNFSIDNGVTVASASLLADGKTVELITSPMASTVTHMLTVSDIVDMAATPNAIAPNTQVEIQRARVSADLVVLYAMNEGSGTVVHDTSGSGVPLDLQIADPARVTWLSGGLSIDQATIISAANASKIAAACQGTDEITVEAWVKPSSTGQSGPARIVTCSTDTLQRNFTLGQDLDDYVARLRTDQTNANGMPNLVAADEVTTALTHVVFTRDATGLWRTLIDGNEEASGQRDGVFSNWNSSWGLALGNEFTSDRPWLGELHLVAIYSRALNDAEIDRNFDAGP